MMLAIFSGLFGVFLTGLVFLVSRIVRSPLAVLVSEFVIAIVVAATWVLLRAELDSCRLNVDFSDGKNSLVYTSPSCHFISLMTSLGLPIVAATFGVLSAILLYWIKFK